MAAYIEPLTLLAAWAEHHPSYSYSVDAMERTAAGTETVTTLRVTYDAAARIETVHVVQGARRGTDLTWAGGPSVEVRPPGLLHAFSLKMPIRDPRALSPRANDIRTGLFERVARCYTENAGAVRAEQADAEHVVLALQQPHVRCGDEDGDGSVTLDRITIDAADGKPVMRERFAGQTLVTRWLIYDLNAPAQTGASGSVTSKREPPANRTSPP